MLYDPYGSIRYSNGAMPGSYGFTGQRADGATGLDDYGARYYDPVAGQFVSADTVADGLSRYGYVAGNPEPQPAPCANVNQTQCGNSSPESGSDGVYDTLRGIAWNEEVWLWNQIDRVTAMKDALVNLFNRIPDLTGFGAPAAIILGLDQAITPLQEIQTLFVEQRGWSNSQWELPNLLAFEAQTEPLLELATLALNAAVAALWQLPPVPIPWTKGASMPAGQIAALYLTPAALAVGSATASVNYTFDQETVVALSAYLTGW